KRNRSSMIPSRVWIQTDLPLLYPFGLDRGSRFGHSIKRINSSNLKPTAEECIPSRWLGLTLNKEYFLVRLGCLRADALVEAPSPGGIAAAPRAARSVVSALLSVVLRKLPKPRQNHALTTTEQCRIY